MIGRSGGDGSGLSTPISLGAVVVGDEGTSVGDDVVTTDEEGGGSSGDSFGVLEESEWSPTGLRGRRRVPLLEFGTMPMESQTIL